MGDELFASGQYEKALDQYRRESNLRMLGCTLEALGQRDAALETYVKAVQSATWDARTHLALAEYHLRAESWEEAEQAARGGLQCPYATAPVKLALTVALATSWMKLGRAQEALVQLEELSKTQDSADLTVRKVKLLAILGRMPEARTAAAQVRDWLAAQAPSSAGLALLGDCHSFLGDLAAAQQAYERALACEPVDSGAWRGLAILAEKTGDKARARERYLRCLERDPLNLAAPMIRQRLSQL